LTVSHQIWKLKGAVCYLSAISRGTFYTQLITNGPYQGGHAMWAMADLLSALVHIHRLGIVHRDVKPENCLLRDDGRLVLSDFGSAANLSEQALLLKRTGSLGYAAPEVLMGRLQDTKVDMFGAGATFFVLMTRKPPFPGRTPSSIIRRTLSGAVNWAALDVEDINLRIYDLLENLLLTNQQLRLSADEALRHVRLSTIIA